MGGAITATTVYQWARSPFAVWCDAHAPHEFRDEPSQFQEMLWQQGREHEARVLSERMPEAAPLRFDTEDQGFALALDAMRAGAPAIAGAPLLLPEEGLGGRADVLVRDESAPSRFGSHHYRVKEIKLARNLGDEHRLQGAFYNHVLGRVQGYLPPTFTLVNGDGEETTFRHDEAEILRALDEIRAIREGAVRPEPTYGGGLWPWETYTDRLAVEADDVSLIGGVGPALRGSLVAAGFATVRALASAQPQALVGIAGVGPVRRAQLPVAASALARGVHVRTGALSLPSGPVEVFLDLEGTSELMGAHDVEPIDYLIGALARRDGREHYHAFVARTLDGEAQMMRDFVAWVAQAPDCILYHWHHYEATHLKRMATRHGLDAQWRTILQPRLRDLHKDATAAFAFPTYGSGLKRIAKYLGFEWRHKEVNAMESIAYYLDYVRDPVANAHKLQKVLDYNEDDCRATRVVKDWLCAQPTEA